MEKRNIGRNKIAFLLFLVAMFALAVRLFYIQIICHEELEEAATSQYEIVVDGLDTRSSILDRNYRPLTDEIKEYYYLIKKEKETPQLNNLIEKIDGKQVASSSSDYYVYRTEIYDQNTIKTLKEKYGAYVFQSTARYSDNQLACHLVGYLNEAENIGVSGLELLYQNRLKTKEKKLYLWADASGNIFEGVSPAIVQNQQSATMDMSQGLVTTIDRRIQYMTEKALKEQTDSGAAIVMDADTGEILSWVSLPNFNPNNIENYLESESDCLINKVSQGAYPPGSVFKIVTALAAMENGIDWQCEYECTGEITVEGITLNCLAGPEEGHGTLNMTKAMAVSCNCYFASLAQKIGYEEVLKMAERLGLGSTVMENFPEESSGNLPQLSETGTWDTSNIAIGQGGILTTPLQVCRMTATIANGGKLVVPKLLKDDVTSYEKILDENNVKVLEGMMQEVMTAGTGSGNWETAVYGKTGTAESSSFGESRNLCWFTGYCRLEDKKYVVTVMVENGESGASEGIPVFKKISDFLSVI